MRIEHVAIYVNDLEGCREFFEKYFEARTSALYHNQNTGFKSYFLSFGDGARLEIMSKPDMVDNPKDNMRSGYCHMAFSIGSREKVRELARQVEADGFRIVSGPRTTGDGYFEFCFMDAEDNLIEVTV